MKEKYIAMVMTKHIFDENHVLLLPKKKIIGTIDEETGNFIDTEGNIYPQFSNSNQGINSECYFEALSLQMFLDEKESQEIQERMIKLYEESGLKSAKFVTKRRDKLSVIPINLENIIYFLDNLINSKDTRSYINDFAQKLFLQEALEMENAKELIKSLAAHIDYKAISEEERQRLINKTAEFYVSLNKIEQRNPKAKVKDETSKESLSIDGLFDEVTKTIIAQDEPVRRVITEISRLNEMKNKNYAILLTGSSGVGKTLLMNLIAEYINKPLLIIDSTQLTIPGYKGKNIEDYLWDLYEKCGKDIEKTEHAIIFCDEIDKKGSESKSDVSGRAVLSTMLKFLDGTTYTIRKSGNETSPEETINIDTSNMIIICGGAFLDVYESKRNDSSIGFSITKSSPKAQESQYEPTIKDFVEKAMMPKEFMGRVPIIIKLNDLNIDALKNILRESDNSALKQQEELFENHGVKLTTKDGYITAVAECALERNIGARGLNAIILNTTWKAYDEICTNPGEYNEVILSKDTVKNPDTYQLVKRK